MGRGRRPDSALVICPICKRSLGLWVRSCTFCERQRLLLEETTRSRIALEKAEQDRHQVRTQVAADQRDRDIGEIVISRRADAARARQLMQLYLLGDAYRRDRAQAHHALLKHDVLALAADVTVEGLAASPAGEIKAWREGEWPEYAHELATAKWHLANPSSGQPAVAESRGSALFRAVVESVRCRADERLGPMLGNLAPELTATWVQARAAIGVYETAFSARQAARNRWLVALVGVGGGLAVGGYLYAARQPRPDQGRAVGRATPRSWVQSMSASEAQTSLSSYQSQALSGASFGADDGAARMCKLKVESVVQVDQPWTFEGTISGTVSERTGKQLAVIARLSLHLRPDPKHPGVWRCYRSRSSIVPTKGSDACPVARAFCSGHTFRDTEPQVDEN